MENSVSERIKILIDTQERGNKAAFGRTVGITGQSVADIMEAKGGPSFATLQKISKAYPDLNLNWLISGDGSMLKGQQPEVTGLTSGAATIEYATELASNGLLREIIASKDQVIASKDVLIESKDNFIAYLQEELGKSGSSPEAAGKQNNTRTPKQGVRRELVAA